MASPTPSTAVANLRPDISGMFMEFDLEANQQRMIGLRVFPVFEAGLQAGPFGKITIESLLRAVRTNRASGGGYNTTEFEFTTDTYATNEHGLVVPVDKRNAAIYANYFDAEVVAAKLARHGVMVNQEARIAAKVFNAGTFSPTAVTNEWDDADNAAPIDDIEAAVQRLYAKGVIANALVLNWKVFRNLRNCGQVIDRITSAGAGQSAKPSQITAQLLATVFDLEQVIVAGAQSNSAAQGQAASIGSVWSDEYAMVCRVASPGASIEEPCLGRTFHWGEDGSSIGGTYESWYDEDIRGDKVRCRMDTDEKLLYSDAGELLSNITT
jgi:hypothetical protein